MADDARAASLKATASVLIRDRRAAVVVRFATRLVFRGPRTVVLSFAASPIVQRSRRSRPRLPVALVVTFVPEARDRLGPFDASCSCRRHHAPRAPSAETLGNTAAPGCSDT